MFSLFSLHSIFSANVSLNPFICRISSFFKLYILSGVLYLFSNICFRILPNPFIQDNHIQYFFFSNPSIFIPPYYIFNYLATKKTLNNKCPYFIFLKSIDYFDSLLP